MTAKPAKDPTRRGANPVKDLARIFTKPSNLLVPGQLTTTQSSYYQDSFYLAELEARRDLADRMLVGPEIQDYVRDVQAMAWPMWQPRANWPVTVRVAPTAMPFYHSSKIVVPSPIRELIVLHELAHHFAGIGKTAHYPLFVQAFLDLVEHVRNAEQAEHFRQVFTAHGVKW